MTGLAGGAGPPAVAAGGGVRHRLQHELDAAVGLAALFGAVVGDRLGLAIAHGRHARHVDPPALQRQQHRLGPGLAQRLVAAIRPLRIGVAADFHLHGGQSCSTSASVPITGGAEWWRSRPSRG
jgi:hypothetical protein